MSEPPLNISKWLATCLVFATAALIVAATELRATAQTARSGGFRQLAPGVLITIPPGCEEQDTQSTHRLGAVLDQAGDVLDWQPNFLAPNETLRSLASTVDFRHTVWCLEFSFKPVRMIWVDVPQTDGTMRRNQIWYLLYRVVNRGGHLKPEMNENGTFGVSRVDDLGEPIYFVPEFELYSHEFKKCYADTLIPVAIPAIQMREDQRRKFHNSVEISEEPLELSTESTERGLWGVATWNGTTAIDPRIDFFSIYVRGLTNAYRWDDVEESQPGQTAERNLRFKTLQLNFWRPGDDVAAHENEIRLGIPLGKEDVFGVTEQMDYRWVYRRSCQ